jgi:hypothetical protein
MALRTSVRLILSITPEQLNQPSARHAVFTTTAIHMQHPVNDFQRWRYDWAEVNRLVDEINRMLRPHR